MWEDNNFQFDDYSFLNSPEFQQQVLDAVGQYEQPSLLPTEVVPSPQSGGVDVAALKALGLSDQEVSQIANFNPSQLNMDLLGTIGGLGVGGGVYNGEYKVFDAPLSNKGNPTSQMGDNKIYIAPQSQVRLVNQATGETITQGVGYDAAQEAIDKAKSLTSSGGNKANWQIQVAAPGEGTFSVAANEKENKNVIGKIADVALPVLASALVPGGGLLGTILPAAAGSAASSVAQGRGLGETLLRSALVGGTAGLGEKFLAPAISSVLTPAAQAGSDAAINATVNAALQNAVSAGAQAGSQALGSVYGSALGSTIGAGAGSAAGSAAAPAIGDIVVTAARNAVPSTLFPAVTSGISNTLLDRAISQPAQVAETQQPAQQEYTPPPEEIVLTAPTGAEIPVIPPLIPDVAPLEQFTPIDEVLKGVDMGPEKQGLLKSLIAKMGPTDYLTAASLLGSAFGGGGGGAGTTAMPYMSPFGAGVGFGTGRDMRVNPNIADYERYAFGPEASFFAPSYSQLVSGAAGAPMTASTPGAFATRVQNEPANPSAVKAASLLGSALLGSPVPFLSSSSLNVPMQTFNQMASQITPEQLQSIGIPMQTTMGPQGAMLNPQYVPLI